MTRLYSNLDGGSVYFDKIQNLSIEHEIAINETFTVEIEKKSTRIQFCLCSLKFLQVSMTKFFIDYHENENIKEVLEINSSRAK